MIQGNMDAPANFASDTVSKWRHQRSDERGQFAQDPVLTIGRIKRVVLVVVTNTVLVAGEVCVPRDGEFA